MANIAKAYRRDSKYLKRSFVKPNLLLLVLFSFMLCVELLFDFTECIRFMLCFVSNNEVNISINQYNQICLSNFRFINEFTGGLLLHSLPQAKQTRIIVAFCIYNME